MFLPLYDCQTRRQQLLERQIHSGAFPAEPGVTVYGGTVPVDQAAALGARVLRTLGAHHYRTSGA
jgi:hypothetical protein